MISLSKKYKIPKGISKNPNLNEQMQSHLNKNNLSILNTNFNLVSLTKNLKKPKMKTYPCHSCDPNDSIYSCDNSYSYISQCSYSFFTNCSILKPFLNCKNESTYFDFAKKFMNEEYFKFSSFGPSSKCVNISKANLKMSICSLVSCHHSKSSYYILFNKNQSKLIKCFNLKLAKEFNAIQRIRSIQ